MELLCLFTVCVAILLLIVKGPEWMKVIFEHRRLMREADENEKGRRFERLRDLHRMVAERKNAELEDRTDDL